MYNRNNEIFVLSFVCLFLLELKSYLLFHTIVEIALIIVTFSLFLFILI